MAAKRKQKRTRTKFVIPENLFGTLAAWAAFLACFRRIGLTNRFGDYGNAYYSAALGLFFLLFVFTGLGMGHAVCAMVQARIERGNVKDARRVVTKAAVYGAFISLIFIFAGYVFLKFFTGTLLNIPLTALVLKAFLPALLPLTVFWTLVGGMDGFGGQAPDFIRFLFYILLFATGPMLTAPFTEYGEKVGALLQNGQYGPAYGAMGGAVSFTVTSLIVMAAALIGWWMTQPAIRDMERMDSENTRSPEKKVYVGIFQNSLSCMLPCGLFMLALIAQTAFFFHTKDAEAFAGRLQAWGIFTGKSGVLLGIPIFGAVAFGLRMMPEFQISFFNRNLKKSKEKCMVALRCCALFTVPGAVLALVLPGPLINLFFREGDLTQAVGFLRIGSICMIFGALAVVLAVILISMDLLTGLSVDIVIAAVLHLAALYGMLRFLELGIFAVLYADIIFFFLLCMFFLVSIKRHLKISFSWIRIFLAPVIGGAVMAAVCAFFAYVLFKTTPMAVTAPVSALAGFAFYVVTVLVLKGAAPRELRAFPCGEKILAFARLIRLM